MTDDTNMSELDDQLLRDRIIFLGREIDSDLANLIVAQLLFLENEDPEKDIYMYINSPGGLVSEGMNIFEIGRASCRERVLMPV